MKRILLWLAILTVISPVVWAATRMQHEGEDLLHVAHLRGVVVDSFGKPVAGAPVQLERGRKAVAETQTDAAGAFNFERLDGEYTLRIKPANYSTATRDVVVGEAATIVMRHNKLYVIVGPRACDDECSSVFTSEREFEKTLSRKSGHTN